MREEVGCWRLRSVEGWAGSRQGVASPASPHFLRSLAGFPATPLTQLQRPANSIGKYESCSEKHQATRHKHQRLTTRTHDFRLTTHDLRLKTRHSHSPLTLIRKATSYKSQASSLKDSHSPLTHPHCPQVALKLPMKVW